MSTLEYPAYDSMEEPGKRRLHRLAHVRHLQGISRRTLARRMKTDVTEIKAQEREDSDLLLSQLYEWQRALEVPVAELLVETDDSLSAPVMRRAQMVRVMKTAMAILERSHQLSIRRMTEVLVNQLIEIMPELSGVAPWQAVGKRRTREEVGQAAQRRISLEVYRNHHASGGE